MKADLDKEKQKLNNYKNFILIYLTLSSIFYSFIYFTHSRKYKSDTNKNFLGYLAKMFLTLEMQ